MASWAQRYSWKSDHYEDPVASSFVKLEDSWKLVTYHWPNRNVFLYRPHWKTMHSFDQPTSYSYDEKRTHGNGGTEHQKRWIRSSRDERNSGQCEMIDDVLSYTLKCEHLTSIKQIEAYSGLLKMVIEDGYGWIADKISFCPWFDFCKREWQFWGIWCVQFQCPFCFGFWGTSRLSDMMVTLSKSGSRVATGWAGTFLLVVAHSSTSSAESVGLLMSLTERRSSSSHFVVII